MGTVPCAALTAAALFINLCRSIHIHAEIGHALIAVLLVIGCYAMLTVRVEPFREVTQRLASQCEPGDGLT